MNAANATTNGPWYKSLPHLFFSLVFCLASANSARAVDACSAPTGSLTITLLTNSDTYVSIPFTRAPEFCGTVQSVSNNAITVQGSPGWTNGQWSTPTTPNQYFPYYAVLTSGSKEGVLGTITNHSADTLILVGVCPELTGASAGDQLAIVPFWTLNTVFPSGTGVVASTLVSTRTQILFPAIPGLSGLPPSHVYYYLNNAWRRSTPAAPASSNFNDVPVLPDKFFIARQNNNARTTTFAPTGSVVQYTTRMCLYASASSPAYDNFVANYHSTTQTLDQANLAAAITASNPGATNPAINDLLLVYDNAAMKKNKAPAHVYFYNVDHWADLNNPPYSVNRGGDPVFIPGTGLTIRRSPGSVSVWVNPP
jgi:uncharacterized protein (TIGR02597 family)